MKLLVIAVFPVPVGPTNNNGFSWERKVSRKYFWRTVSVVEMMTSCGYKKVHRCFINQIKSARAAGFLRYRALRNILILERKYIQLV